MGLHWAESTSRRYGFLGQGQQLPTTGVEIGSGGGGTSWCDDLVQVPTVKTTGGSTSCTSLCFSLQKAKFQELYLSNVIQCGGEMLVLVFMLCGDWKKRLCALASGWDDVRQECGVISIQCMWQEVGVNRWCDRRPFPLGVTWVMLE
jgi:hypothetical protein